MPMSPRLPNEPVPRWRADAGPDSQQCAWTQTATVSRMRESPGSSRYRGPYLEREPWRGRLRAIFPVSEDTDPPRENGDWL